MRKYIWITYGIFLFFIVAFFGFYNHSLSKELEESRKETLQEKQRTDSVAQIRDSMFIGQMIRFVSSTDHPLDSAAVGRLSEEIASAIKDRHALVAGSKEYILEKSIDDTRQETNNIINKVNGWISFWIAMLAFVGGLIPALMAVRNAEEGERKLGQYKESLEQLFHTKAELIKKECSHQLSSWQVEGKELKQLQKELTLENEKNKIISIVNTIITSVTPSIIKCHENRKELMRVFLFELHKNYSSFINNLIKKQSSDSLRDYTDEVIMVLIHMELGLIKSRTVYVDCHINREFDTVLSGIKKVIDKLIKNKRTTEELVDDLNQIYACFPALLRVI